MSKKLVEVPLGVYKGYTLPVKFSKLKDKIEAMEVYEDDVWVCGYPRSGTTWLQYFVWCIYNRKDLKKQEVLSSVFRYLDYSQLFPEDNDDLPDYMKDSAEKIIRAPRPRFIKTTLPFDLLPKQLTTFEKRPKILHIVRDPRDTCSSNYSGHQLYLMHVGDYDSFCRRWAAEKTAWSPYCSFIESYYKHKNEKNILFLRYDEMTTNTQDTLLKIASFLHVSLSDEEVRRILPKLDFTVMKANPLVNKSEALDTMRKYNLGNPENFQYYRVGKSGRFAEEMSEEVQRLIEESVLEKLAKIGLVYEESSKRQKNSS